MKFTEFLKIQFKLGNFNLCVYWKIYEIIKIFQGASENRKQGYDSFL